MIKTAYPKKCSTWNIALTGTQLDLLDKYAELLVSYNEKGQPDGHHQPGRH